ncbi:MAG TPA: FkbM family methyltransferase [Candidatus Acidoferrum sp.]|nr:FkbM family methyltransferase [Candidatus Acidoferrum sp.]
MSAPVASLQNRLLAVALRFALRLLAHSGPFTKADLPVILSNQLERIMNLPGGLPFFPTAPVSADTVGRLLSKLHPVKCSKPLIRLGPNGDGGYLVPDDLEGIKACFSPGVGMVAGFELDCAERGMSVYLADGSVSKPPVDHPRFRFVQKFIGDRTRGDTLALGEWVEEALGDSGGDLLLQMDIEGSEYGTLLATSSRVLARFRIIAIELHDLELLFSAPVFGFYRQVFEKLLDTHTCVHIHPNNYCPPFTVGGLEALSVAEFTFLRKDRVLEPVFADAFPHKLDQDNTGKPGFPLPRSFYRAASRNVPDNGS